MSDRVRIALAAGVAVLLASLTVVPIFERQSWLLPTWAAVGLAVGTGIGLRALGVPRLLVPVGQLAVLAEALLLVVAGHRMEWVVVPTADAVRDVVALAGQGLLDISRYAVPVPAEPGLLLVTAAGIALVAVATDLLAATLRLVPWAGLPLLATYAVPAAVVPGGIPWYFFAPLAAGYIGLLVAEGRHRVASWGRPVVGGSTRGRPARTALQTGALAATGRRVGASVIVLAVVVPAVLPGLPDAVFGRGAAGGGDGAAGSGRTIRTNNPIVDLRRDLVRPDNVEVLRYRTDAPERDYIRLVALDVFNGRVWQNANRNVPRSQQVDEGLPTPPGLADDVERAVFRTEWKVSDRLASRWLPLTYPTSAVAIDGDWRFDVDTLDVVAVEGDSRGIEYTTTALLVRPTAEQLESAGPPPEELRSLTELSAGSAEVADQALAEALSGTERSDYERAVAIQQWFRGGFEYSTQRRPGNSDTALADFLRDRSGYCEQFAATMAIMTRRLGIPSRVGVGFLPGTENADGEWVVRANDAHAWPELYFSGVGWVRFEPTPSDRVARAPSYTAPPPTTPTAGPTTGPSASATESGGSTNLPGGVAPEERFGTGATDEVAQPLPWGRITAAALIALAVGATPAAALLARRRRWHAAEGDPVATAEAGWAEVRDAARDAGLTWAPTLSPRAQAQSLIKQVLLPSRAATAVERLARGVELARYSRRPEEAAALRDDAALVRAAMLRDRALRVRWRARLLPTAGGDAFAALGSAIGSLLDWLDLLRHRLRSRLALWLRPGRRAA